MKICLSLVHLTTAGFLLPHITFAQELSFRRPES